ncbi:MAG: hypothetical protein B655_1514 [Methanobacterium sp. Maddingley MBC34]|nr:MAG: hypothetical protein B655_1514 [Methanobacterium sp. Maddingley MBC34]
MNKRNILILIVVVLLIMVVAVGYFLMQSLSNVTPNVTNNTTTNNTIQVNVQQNQANQTQSNFISASKAKSIASNYLTSDSKNVNLEAGTPSLKGSVYYVPMVVANDYSQSAKGTVVGYVKVDAKTGTVLGTETWDIETGESIEEPP